MGMTFKQIIFALVLTSLIGSLLIMAVVDTGNNYGKDLTQVSQGTLNLDSFNSSLNSVTTQSQSTLDSFTNQSIFVSITNLVISGVFNVFSSMTTMVISPFTLIMSVLTNIFQVPAIVTNTILGLLLVTIIFAIWQLIKIGNS